MRLCRSSSSTAAAGTATTSSDGPRPPCHSGTVTASGPSRPLRPSRGAGRPLGLEPVAAPEAELATLVGHHLHGRQPQRGDPAGGPRRTLGPSLQLPAHPFGQGGGAEALGRGARVRSWRSPCSVSTRTRQVVTTIPRPAVSAWRSSARCLAANTTGPLWSTGGSKARWTVSSGGGDRVPGGRSSSPQAAWWACRPAGPNRPSTSGAGGQPAAPACEAEAPEQVRPGPARPAVGQLVHREGREEARAGAGGRPPRRPSAARGRGTRPPGWLRTARRPHPLPAVPSPGPVRPGRR